MKRWEAFAHEAPVVANGGRVLIYQFGIGLGFLATIRRDGGPRLHPVCPIVANGGLYVFVLPSPKLNDLRRDGRVALHSFPPAEIDDEFAVTGRATEVVDSSTRMVLEAAYQNEASAEEVLFELHLETALLARYASRGVFPPEYSRWNANDGLIP